MLSSSAVFAIVRICSSFAVIGTRMTHWSLISEKVLFFCGERCRQLSFFGVSGSQIRIKIRKVVTLFSATLFVVFAFFAIHATKSLLGREDA